MFVELFETSVLIFYNYANQFVFYAFSSLVKYSKFKINYLAVFHTCRNFSSPSLSMSHS